MKVSRTVEESTLITQIFNEFENNAYVVLWDVKIEQEEDKNGYFVNIFSDLKVIIIIIIIIDIFCGWQMDGSTSGTFYVYALFC